MLKIIAVIDTLAYVAMVTLTVILFVGAIIPSVYKCFKDDPTLGLISISLWVLIFWILLHVANFISEVI